MKITYTGREHKLTPPQQKKLDAKFTKLSKLMDNRKGEKEAHVILTNERHLNRAEITVQCMDRAMVGVGADSDLAGAIAEAIENLEKQLLKLRAKRRDTHRGGKETWEEVSAPEAAGVVKAEREEPPDQRVFRVDSNPPRKPMTLDEAVLEMEKARDYLVYRDAETGRVSVLVRRSDGNFDLVES